MNWKEIKEKFPICFDTLFGNKPDERYTIDVATTRDGCYSWLASFDNNMYEYSFEYHFRNLYDFFDKHGFYIHIEPYLGGGQPVFYPVVMYRNSEYVDIFDKPDKGISEYYIYRTEAENMAFMKAFELLERQLTKEEDEVAGKL